MEPKDILKAHLAKTITLTDDEFDYFYSHFKPYSFKKGQAIISVGDKVNCEYFVLNGCLKTFYINDDQKMFILQFAMSTWWASDYNALYSDVSESLQGLSTNVSACIMKSGFVIL